MNEKRDRIGVVLYGLYILLLLASVLVVGKVIFIQCFFKPEPKIERALKPPVTPRRIEPLRGNIIDAKGRLLAMSYPVYDIHMDCTVGLGQKEEKEQKWRSDAKALSEGLAEIFPGKTAKQYYNLIIDGRENGKKYVQISNEPVDRATRNKIAELPLFRDGRNRGGLIAEQQNVRRYPYGSLARRTIGFVRDNRSEVGNTHIGLEGKFDHELHGTDGIEWTRKTDNGQVHNYDSVYVKAIDGCDIRTTIDIDLQDAADRALREQIIEENDLEGACLVLMDVKTGAIRAMVNLSRDRFRAGHFEEIQNMAIGRKGEPGSVFKTVTLMSVLSDGHIKSLEDKIPTNHGHIVGTTFKPDHHIVDYEWAHKTNQISIYDGFKMSSNYVFATLAIKNYAKNPKRYIEKIFSYKLGEAFEFDLDGLASPTIPTPETRYWTDTDLGSMGFGYSTEETPLHILAFYNAIANKGKMMKPYLVESIEKDGSVVSKRGPSVLNASICSRAVADTLTRALIAVTEEGTARRLKTAKCTVAGKTGTAFVPFENGQYQDAQGRKIYSGTFAGFFPAEDPRYSIICKVFSKPTHLSYQGGGIPARAIKTLVDYIYNIDPYWRERISVKARVDRSKDAAIQQPQLRDQETPTTEGAE